VARPPDCGLQGCGQLRCAAFSPRKLAVVLD
jgi:hypothetical protein